MPRAVLRSLACAVVLSALASPVLAHAELTSAHPGPGDRLTVAPSELVADFTQDLDPARSSLELRDASGARIVKGGELGDGPRQFRLDLPALAPGEYEVRWVTLSKEDGEIFRGTYTFEVVATTPAPTLATTSLPSVEPWASTTPSPGPAFPSTIPSPLPTQGSVTGALELDAVVFLPIVIAALVVAAFGVWMLRRQRR